VEKYVNNGAQAVAASRDIEDTVGDLLASSNFNINGSLLVIQQHCALVNICNFFLLVLFIIIIIIMI
jgi:hypothetical protein